MVCHHYSNFLELLWLLGFSNNTCDWRNFLPPSGSFFVTLTYSFFQQYHVEVRPYPPEETRFALPKIAFHSRQRRLQADQWRFQITAYCFKLVGESSPITVQCRFHAQNGSI